MNKNRGFTLLELLIAIAIFAVLSLGAYQVLSGVIQSDHIAEAHTQKLKQLQRAFMLISRDFEQATARPLRDEGEKAGAPFRAAKFLNESEFDGLTMVRLGWRNPQGQLPRSGLQRVGYLVRDGELIRRFYLYPDPVVGAEAREEALLSDITDLTFRYYKDNEWREKWTDKQSLPDGVKMSLDIDGFGKIERIFILSAGVIPPVGPPKSAGNGSNSGNGS